MTPVRSTTHPVDESSFLASGDRSEERYVVKTPFGSIDGSSPDVAVRAGRVHAVAAPNGGG
eukprot:3496867-Amphidinium_carterae.1